MNASDEGAGARGVQPDLEIRDEAQAIADADANPDGPQVLIDGQDAEHLFAELQQLEAADETTLTSEQLARLHELRGLFTADDPDHVMADPIDLAGQLLVEALAALRTPASTGQHHSPTWRLAEKIALGHAMSVHAHAAAARVHANVARQQLALMLEQRQALAGRQGGPAASIVVPTVHLPNGRG